jgi:hypothetical protein
MRGIEGDDSEMAYRRGYEHGVIEMFHAVERFLAPATREVLRAWFKKTFTDGGTRQCSAVRRFGG